MKNENNQNNLIEENKELNELENTENSKMIEGNSSYSELESQLVNKDIEIQNLNQEIQNLKSDNEEKDKLIRAQASQLNLYITKNNKAEITIDALQDKLISIINSIK